MVKILQVYKILILVAWIDLYSRRRYGRFLQSMQDAWNILYHTIYNCTDGAYVSKTSLSSTVIGFLQGAAIVFGCFWCAAKVHRERSYIYITSLFSTCILILLRFDVSQWTLKVRKLCAYNVFTLCLKRNIYAYVLLALFMGYLVLYSQEILYNARFGEINFANCAFTIFFCLPAIVVHAVRLCLGANIEQHRQN
uniref:Alpha-N-acetylglucosaminidase C-terminal domain-containing protein n=1 Tax=Solanum lycopersicum TaxID=4081 RepID=A0A3Q7FQ36_SOLLC